MKPNEYDGKTRDARIVDTWLLRMTNYLTLTKTEENDKVGFAMSYLTSDALDWYMTNQTALAAGNFDDFKTLLRNHFVPQNYKSVTYNQYKVLKQGTLSVSEYSGKMKSLADQIPELVLPQLATLTSLKVFSTTSRDSSFLNPLLRTKLGQNLSVVHCVLKRHCHLVINTLLIDPLLCLRVLVVVLNSLVPIAPAILTALAIPIAPAIGGRSRPPLLLLRPSNLSPNPTENF